MGSVMGELVAGVIAGVLQSVRMLEGLGVVAVVLVQRVAGRLVDDGILVVVGGLHIPASDVQVRGVVAQLATCYRDRGVSGQSPELPMSGTAPAFVARHLQSCCNASPKSLLSELQTSRWVGGCPVMLTWDCPALGVSTTIRHISAYLAGAC